MSVNERESLRPTENRILGNSSLFLMQVGGMVAIAIFSLGADLLGKLNIYQAIVAVILGSLMSSVLQAVNGRPGQKYGIPYAIQLRSSFGTLGTKIPGIIRIVPALIWFGFQSWIAAEAINIISETLFGFGNVVVFFILFQGIQVLLAFYGFGGIKLFENVGAVVVLIALGFMFFHVLDKYGLAIADNVVNIEGSWGLPLLAGAVVLAGNAAAVALSFSDITRHYIKEPGSVHLTSLIFFAVTPATFFMAMIGLMVAGATGSYDPVAIFSDSIDNPLLLIVTLAFIVFAQMTTNIISNIVPSVYFLMDLFKVKYRTSVIITGILPMFAFPWTFVGEGSASGLTSFIQIFSGFVGPVFTIMIVDYYFIRKKKLNLDILYDENGPFKGVNPAGLIATGIGAAFGLYFIDYSWIVSMIPAGLSYYLLMKHMKSSRRFLTETDMGGELSQKESNG